MEQISFRLFSDSGSRGYTRVFFLETLLATLPFRIGDPTSAMRLDWKEGTQMGSELGDSWQSKPFITRELAATELLFIYTTPKGGGDFKVILSIWEAGKAREYTITITQDDLLVLPLEVIENWLVDLFRVMNQYISWILLAGSEIDLDTEKTYEETTRKVFDRSNYYWLVVEDSLLGGDFGDFEVARKLDGFTMLHRKAALDAIGFVP